MPRPNVLTLARLGYSAYSMATGTLNARGEPTPAWTDLGDPIQFAWMEVAGAVITALRNPGPASEADVPAALQAEFAAFLDWRITQPTATRPPLT